MINIPWTKFEQKSIVPFFFGGITLRDAEQENIILWLHTNVSFYKSQNKSNS